MAEGSSTTAKKAVMAAALAPSMGLPAWVVVGRISRLTNTLTIAQVPQPISKFLYLNYRCSAGKFLTIFKNIYYLHYLSSNLNFVN